MGASKNEVQSRLNMPKATGYLCLAPCYKQRAAHRVPSRPFICETYFGRIEITSRR